MWTQPNTLKFCSKIKLNWQILITYMCRCLNFDTNKVVADFSRISVVYSRRYGRFSQKGSHMLKKSTLLKKVIIPHLIVLRLWNSNAESTISSIYMSFDTGSQNWGSVMQIMSWSRVHINNTHTTLLLHIHIPSFTPMFFFVVSLS